MDKNRRKIETSITFLKTVMVDFNTEWGYKKLFTAIQTILPEIEAIYNEKNPEVKIEVGEYKGK